MTTTSPNGSSSRRKSVDSLPEVITPDEPPVLTDDLARALLRVLRGRVGGERQSRGVAS